MDKKERTEFINNALLDYRGSRWMPWLNFDSEAIPHVAYYYDENDDSLHAGAVSIPFHYKTEEIKAEIIDDCLEELHVKVWQYYNDKGIELRFYED